MAASFWRRKVSAQWGALQPHPAVMACLAALIACEGATTPKPPTQAAVGTIVVSVAVSGNSNDVDGFLVQSDAGPAARRAAGPASLCTRKPSTSFELPLTATLTTLVPTAASVGGLGVVAPSQAINAARQAMTARRGCSAPHCAETFLLQKEAAIEFGLDLQHCIQHVLHHHEIHRFAKQCRPEPARLQDRVRLPAQLVAHAHAQLVVHVFETQAVEGGV